MATEQFGVEFFSTGFATLENQLRTIDKSIGDLGEVSKRSGSFIADTLSTALGNVLAKSIDVAVSSLAKLGSASVEFLGDSFSAAVDFESAIAQLGIAANKTGKDMQDLHDVAIAVGGASNLVGVDASQAAEAMTSLFKSGLTTTQILGDLNAVMENGNNVSGALRASIELAAATTLDLGQSADLASKLMATFGNDAKEAGMNVEDWIVLAMDNLVKAADASVAEVDGLAQALTYVGPIAANAGLSLGETTNALALLSKSGIESTMAGTNLRQMLSSLIAPTKQGTETLAQIGVSMFNADGTTRSFTDVLFDLNKALFDTKNITIEVGGRTEEQNALLAEAQKRYEQLTKRIQNHNQGLVVMSDSALAKANSELAASSSIISELSGIQGNLVNSTKRLTDAEREEAIGRIFTVQGANALKVILQQVNQTNENGVNGWDAMLQATESATGVFEQSATKSKTFAGRMEALRGVIETLQIQIGEKFLESGTKMVNLFIELSNKYGPIIIQTFDEIAKKLSFLGDALFELLSGNPDAAIQRIKSMLVEMFGFDVGNRFTSMIREVPMQLRQLADDVSAIFANMTQGIANITFPIVEEIKSRFDFSSALSNLLPTSSTIIDIIKRISEAFLEFTKGNTESTLNKIFSVLSQIFGIDKAIDFVLALRKIPEIFEKIKSVGESVWNSVVAVFKSVISVFVENILPNILNLGKKFSDLGITWEIVAGIIGGVAQFVASIFVAALGVIIALFDGVISAIDKLTDYFPGIAESFTSFVTNLVGLIQGFVDLVTAIIQGDWQAAGQALLDIITSAVMGIVDIFLVAGKLVAAALDTIVTFISSFVDSIIKFFENLAKELVGNSIVPDMLEAILAAFIQFGTDVLDNMAEFIASLLEFIALKLEEFYQLISSKLSEIRGFWSSTWSGILEDLRGNLNAIVAMVTEKAQDIYNAITTKIAAIGTWITEQIEVMKAWGKTIIDNIVAGINGVADNIKSAVVTAINAIGDGINNVKDTLVGFGSSIINFIADGISGAGDTISSAISGILSGIENAVQFGQDVISGLFSIGAKIVSLIVDGIVSGVSAIADAIKDLIFEAFTTFLPDIISQVVEAVLELLQRVPGLDYNSPNPNSPNNPGTSNLQNPYQSNVPLFDTSTPLSGNTTNNNVTRNYNLTTQSLTSPQSLAMEFETMTLIGR